MWLTSLLRNRDVAQSERAAPRMATVGGSIPPVPALGESAIGLLCQFVTLVRRKALAGSIPVALTKCGEEEKASWIGAWPSRHQNREFHNEELFIFH